MKKKKTKVNYKEKQKAIEIAVRNRAYDRILAKEPIKKENIGESNG